MNRRREKRPLKDDRWLNEMRFSELSSPRSHFLRRRLRVTMKVQIMMSIRLIRYFMGNLWKLMGSLTLSPQRNMGDILKLFASFPRNTSILGEVTKRVSKRSNSSLKRVIICFQPHMTDDSNSGTYSLTTNVCELTLDIKKRCEVSASRKTGDDLFQLAWTKLFRNGIPKLVM